MRSRPLAVAAIAAAMAFPAATAASAADRASSRSTDCAHAAAPASSRLSVAEAREILSRQFSPDGTQHTPLAFDGLEYACVTSYRSEDLREVAVFGRKGASDLRLFVTGDAEAARLSEAINRLIHEAQLEQRKANPKGTKPAPRATP
jgi:hypothetical protein